MNSELAKRITEKKFEIGNWKLKNHASYCRKDDYGRALVEVCPFIALLQMIIPIVPWLTILG